ncbi:MAG: hypothetical protein LLF97_01440 [Planctomycetaceae bacterium]|nr:hypothetical protein [Planctomycetaceae bacterium]
MSMFEDSRYRWRETYFVLYDAHKRPKLDDVVRTLSSLNKRFQLTNQSADEQGRLDSLTLLSPDDYAAMDICCADEDEVQDQADALVADLKKAGADVAPPVPWEQIKKYDGRLDVLHFEQMPEDADDEEGGMLDPSALLMVLGALAQLTGGVAVDPQAGTFVTED